MKLQYLYNNNNNLKYSVKVFSLFCISVIIFCFLLIIITEKNANYSLFLMILLGTISFSTICNIISALIIGLWNNYKRKQFLYIKNNGSYFEGEIIMANYHNKGYNKYHWLLKDSGDIIVCVNDKTYKISDIDYNKEFKTLKQKLNDSEEINTEQINNINSVYKETGILNKIDFKNITIGIYVLEDKAVADLDSIKMN